MSKEQVSADSISAKVTPTVAVSTPVAPVAPVAKAQITTVSTEEDEDYDAASTRPVMKKRVRVRKKATKKLSAAIICANPSIRRFI